MKKVLIQYGKYGDLIYDCSTEELKFKASLNLVALNNDFEHYFDDDKKKADEILEKSDGKKAYRFLLNRSHHEYERIEEHDVK